MARALALAVLACLVYAAAAAEVGQPTTYAQLATTVGKQWKIDIEKQVDANAALEPVVCNETAASAPCLQPRLSADNGAKLKITYKLSDELRTYDNLPAKGLLFMGCYAPPSTADRPWRKASPIIDKDKSCPFVLGKSELNSTDGTYTVNWALPKNTTTGIWYTQVRVQCQNGTLTSYCQFDTTQNATYWATSIINTIPPALKVATGVCASLGPLFLAAFFLKDFFMKKK